MDQKVRLTLRNLEAGLKQGHTNISLQLIVLPIVFHPRKPMSLNFLFPPDIIPLFPSEQGVVLISRSYGRNMLVLARLVFYFTLLLVTNDVDGSKGITVQMTQKYSFFCIY